MNIINNTKTDSATKKPVEPIALLDCGKASEVTKGFPYFFYYEFGSPPFDRAPI